jgi:hypothetical protein
MMVGKTAPPYLRSRAKVTPSSKRVCAITETKSVNPRMNSIVSMWNSSSRPLNDSTCARIHHGHP